MTSTVNPGTAATEAGVQRATIAEMLLDRVGDDRLGLRTREQDWNR